MKIGIVDIGGGMRGIYAAGVFDYCMDANLHFDLCIGVSAGSANGASYVAGQKGRNYRFYTRYPFRKEYMSLDNILSKGSYLDLDYVYGTLSRPGGEDPFDYDSFMMNRCEFYAVATNAHNGMPRYFSKWEIDPATMEVFKASSAIPFVSRPHVIDGADYFDGALSDPIPIDEAFRLGCDRVVLLLTRPRDWVRKADKDEWLAKMIRRKYPVAADRLRARARRYNEGIEKARQYEAEGKLCIVAPEDTCGVDTLTRDKTAMRQLYAAGYQDGPKAAVFFE